MPKYQAVNQDGQVVGVAALGDAFSFYNATAAYAYPSLTEAQASTGLNFIKIEDAEYFELKGQFEAMWPQPCVVEKSNGDLHLGAAVASSGAGCVQNADSTLGTIESPTSPPHLGPVLENFEGNSQAAEASAPQASSVSDEGDHDGHTNSAPADEQVKAA